MVKAEKLGMAALGDPSSRIVVSVEKLDAAPPPLLSGSMPGINTRHRRR
jgi:hypothetical protein